MDWRRIMASSKSWCRRRVVAKERPCGGLDGSLNSVNKLQRREISSKRDRTFSMSCAQERFRNIHLQEEYDTHDPNGSFPFLNKRSMIIEIVAARDIVFALAQSGGCAAFSRESNQRIFFLNICPDEVIWKFFYNKNNDSIITVSCYVSNNVSSLKCRSTRIEYIRRGKPDSGFPLFESESLKMPSFVKFNDIYGKILIYSAQDSIYKVFDLKSYTLLYSISDKNIKEVKISRDKMLLIFPKTYGGVPLKILSIEDGSVLKSFTHPLHKNKKVIFMELFSDKLLVIQENENLQIVDIRNTEIKEVSWTKFRTPSALIFLSKKQLFLTSRKLTFSLWNLRGELLTSFKGYLLRNPDCNKSNTYITSDNDLIISHCKADSKEHLSDGHACSIIISNIMTGKCIAKINGSNGLPTKECYCSLECGGRNCSGSSRKPNNASEIRNTAGESLEDVTTLFYNEDLNEIYTGNRLGLVHVWSN